MDYRIKEICRGKGIAVGALADTVGIQRESMSRIINGANTSTDTLERIATALEVPITELFDPPPTVSAGANVVCPVCGTALKLNAEIAEP